MCLCVGRGVTERITKWEYGAEGGKVSYTVGRMENIFKLPGFCDPRDIPF